MMEARGGEPVTCERAVDRPITSIDWDELISVDADARVREVAALMARRDVGAVVVHGSGRDPGILSERDIVRALAAGADIDRATCGDLAHTGLVTVDASELIVTAIDRMLAEGIRHLAVVDGDAIVTLLSIRDLLASSAA